MAPRACEQALTEIYLRNVNKEVPKVNENIANAAKLAIELKDVTSTSVANVTDTAKEGAHGLVLVFEEVGANISVLANDIVRDAAQIHDDNNKKLEDKAAAAREGAFAWLGGFQLDVDNMVKAFKAKLLQSLTETLNDFAEALPGKLLQWLKQLWGTLIERLGCAEFWYYLWTSKLLKIIVGGCISLVAGVLTASWVWTTDGDGAAGGSLLFLLVLGKALPEHAF